MYERFTDRTRKVLLQLANQEAQRLNHAYIGTEHILLGLVKEGSGVAAYVLKNLDIDLGKIRREIEKIVQTGPDMVAVERLPQTPRAKKVIEYSIEEARNLKHNYVGTEHLLLGLLREQEGIAAQVLMSLSLKLEDVREEILCLLGQNVEVQEGESKQSEPAAAADPYAKLQHLPEHALQALKKLDAQIDQFTVEKEDAIAEQDFEKAAHLRDQADKLKKKRQSILREWSEPR